MPTLIDSTTPEEAAAFVKRERQRRGWSARQFAQKISEMAALTGEEVTLTQQAISFFETGKSKSFPRWLRHANLAFVTDEIGTRATPAPQPSSEDPRESLTVDDRDWLDLIHNLPAEERATLRHVARGLAAISSVAEPVHAG